MLLPGRSVIVDRLGQMIDSTSAALAVGSTWPDPPDPPARYPALYLVGIEGHRELVTADSEGCASAMIEVSRRLDRLVRGTDLLGYIAPGTFALAASSVTPPTAGTLVERIEGAVALPLDVVGQVVSLRAFVALAFADGDQDAEQLMASAESRLERLLG